MTPTVQTSSEGALVSLLATALIASEQWEYAVWLVGLYAATRQITKWIGMYVRDRAQ